MAEPALLGVLVVLAAVCSADDGGRRTRLALPNGVQTDYVYAANDRLMSLVTTKGAATLASFAYTHDAVGNRTGITLANGETLVYTYDNAYRLTRELRKDAAQQTLFDQTFVYDAVGNRTSTVKDGITTTYVYSNANQLTTETTGNTVKTYTYDANGSQTLIETRVSGQLTVTEQTWYDQLSRRTQYTKTEGGTPTSESFTYRGAAWHRRTQTASGVTTTFLYDGDNVACDFIAGSLDSFYVTPFLDENLSLTRQSATHYYSHDGLGSVRTVTDAAGTLVNTYAYTAFGEPYAPGTSVTLPQRYTFTGREQNPVSDTMFYRYRPYSPSLGTMLNRNPWGYIHRNPSLYDAMDQDPINRIEPFSFSAFGRDSAPRFPRRSDPDFRRDITPKFRKHRDPHPGRHRDPDPGKHRDTNPGRHRDPDWRRFRGPDIRNIDRPGIVRGRAARAAEADAWGRKAARELGLAVPTLGVCVSRERVRRCWEELQSGTLSEDSALTLVVIVLAATTFGPGEEGDPADGTGGERGAGPPPPDGNEEEPHGQIHHPVSRRVHRALEAHDTLKAEYEYRDPRFETQATHAEAHRGYQGWHRDADS